MKYALQNSTTDDPRVTTMDSLLGMDFSKFDDPESKELSHQAVWNLNLLANFYNRSGFETRKMLDDLILRTVNRYGHTRNVLTRFISSQEVAGGDFEKMLIQMLRVESNSN